MAKNKAKAQLEEEVIGKEKVTFEEVKGGSSVASGAPQSFFQKYRNFIVIGGIGAVVVGIFLVLRMSGREEANKEGQVAMINAVLNYEKDSFQLALAGGPQGQGFESLAEEFGNSDAGQLSKFYAGTSLLQIGSIDQGLEHLEAYSKGKNMVSAAAYAAIGFAHEQKAEFVEAAEAYEDAASAPGENSFSTPFYLMHAARNYESAGNNDKALNIYRDIKQNYPLSTEGGSVDKYIAKLSPEDE